MIKWRYLLLMAAVLMLFSGCSGKNTQPAQISRAESGSVSVVKKQLYSQYRAWKGTRYRIGGLDRSGIDCSGFAKMTFRSKFGISLPRTTEEQAGAGAPISQNVLRAGDLVFFKTGRTVRHVGIYLENRKFLHASTSKGVIISSMDNVYWKARYWKARRVL